VRRIRSSPFLEAAGTQPCADQRGPRDERLPDLSLRGSKQRPTNSIPLPAPGRRPEPRRIAPPSRPGISSSAILYAFMMPPSSPPVMHNSGHFCSVGRARRRVPLPGRENGQNYARIRRRGWTRRGLLLVTHRLVGLERTDEIGWSSSVRKRRELASSGRPYSPP
jgi:hypothetical protein